MALQETCLFDGLLDDTLHPGGMNLSRRLATQAGIGPNHIVLDIASGRGATASFLAREQHCRVVSLDLSQEMMVIGRQRAADDGMLEIIDHVVGDAELLPFDGCSFDIVISECSFSLLPNKEVSAREVCRVLKHGGKLAMTDIILKGKASEEVRAWSSFACCLGGARRLEEYLDLFAGVGLKAPYVEDHSVEMKKLAFRLGLAFGAPDSLSRASGAGPCKSKMKRANDEDVAAQPFAELVRNGKPGYALLTMSKA